MSDISRERKDSMTEVLFGESEAGLMKTTQNMKDVICLNILLDIGDIRLKTDASTAGFYQNNRGFIK